MGNSFANKGSTLIVCVWWLQLDLWYVILNGAIEISYPDSRMKTLCMGNSFGISPSLDKQYMDGEVRTKGDDCQVKETGKTGSSLSFLFQIQKRIIMRTEITFAVFVVLSAHTCVSFIHTARFLKWPHGFLSLYRQEQTEEELCEPHVEMMNLLEGRSASIIAAALLSILSVAVA